MRWLFYLVAAACLTPVLTRASAQDAPPQPEALAFTNGLWYDGKGFKREESVYAVDGKFTRKKPAAVTRIVDLAGKFVIPPLGDAHCHHFDSIPMVQQLTPRYLKEGVFYAQSMTNWISGRKAVAGLVNKPTGVDVAYADAALTSTYGHGFQIYENLANGIYSGWGTPENKEKIRNSRKALNDAYYFVDTPEMLNEVWSRIEKSPPDLLKVYLLHSEKHAELVRGDGFGDKGLDPALVPEVVKRAHNLGLRVYAHVETNFDFRVALKAGVDGFAHLPGYSLPLDRAHPDLYELTEDDARLAAKNKVIVQPTYSLAAGYTRDSAILDEAKALERKNLAILKKHGVPVVVASDSYGSGPWAEAEYLSDLGIYSAAELLKIWTETTPQSIFPRRKIGRLADGYEASFLALEKNPLETLQNLKTIRLRVKQGVLLPEPDMPPPSSATGVEGHVMQHLH